MNYIQYGTQANATEIETFLNHVLKSSRIPICIWGKHGIGKTELVQDFAKANDFDFVYIAPAQFEEMGDLVGMPKIVDGKTVFAAPNWIPTTNRKGILLIDDVNRADDRILRGIMQLLQNYELVSWKLPESWQIILTANPDGGDYSVTPMDDAMLTRMLHITMTFDVKTWAKWANENGIDNRCINFVLTHPNVITGERTTPRTLVQFFQNIQTIDNWQSNLDLIQLLGDATLDAKTVASFIAFVQNDMQLLLSPNEILDSQDFEDEVENRLYDLVVGDSLRIDILATICTRLIQTVDNKNFKINDLQLENLKSFIKLDFLPDDLRLTFAQDLVKSENTDLKNILKDAEIGRLVLSRI
ncbi:MAG: AAA family ATPase [Saprospiraceae bacterium]